MSSHSSVRDLCICIIFRVLYAPVAIVYSCMMGLSPATASAAVVCSVYSKWGVYNRLKRNF